MANEQNLRPFPKGVSGNPNGRPKGPSIATILKKLLKKSIPAYLKDDEGIKQYIEETGKKRISYQEATAIKLMHMALHGKGNLWAMQEIMNRTEPLEVDGFQILPPPNVIIARQSDDSDESSSS